MILKLPLKLSFLLFFLLLATAQCALAQTVPNDSLQQRMAVEELKFRQNLQSRNVQKQQAYAINQAIAGDTINLQLARNSRNVSPQLSENIRTEQVAPNLRLFSPKQKSRKPRPVLLYLHGGGWCLGSINSCANFCADVAERANCCVVALNYPLAPEAPYPAALNSCVEAFHFIKANAKKWGADSTLVSIGGDSAGGNLAIATAFLVKGVRSIVPIYPVTKLQPERSVSYIKYAQGYGNDTELLHTFYKAYVGTDSVANPLISVGLAPDSLLRRLPPMLLLSAGHDVLAHQGQEFAERVQKATHLPVDYQLFPTATHLFITVSGQPTAYAQAVQLVSQFLAPTSKRAVSLSLPAHVE